MTIEFSTYIKSLLQKLIIFKWLPNNYLNLKMQGSIKKMSMVWVSVTNIVLIFSQSFIKLNLQYNPFSREGVRKNQKKLSPTHCQTLKIALKSFWKNILARPRTFQHPCAYACVYQYFKVLFMVVTCPKLYYQILNILVHNILVFKFFIKSKEKIKIKIWLKT